MLYFQKFWKKHNFLLRGNYLNNEQIEQHISRFFDYLNVWTPLHRPDEGASTEARINRIQSNDVLDVKYGFDRYKDSVDRLGWLINMHPVR